MNFFFKGTQSETKIYLAYFNQTSKICKAHPHIPDIKKIAFPSESTVRTGDFQAEGCSAKDRPPKDSVVENSLPFSLTPHPGLSPLSHRVSLSGLPCAVCMLALCLRLCILCAHKLGLSSSWQCTLLPWFQYRE